MSKQVSSGLVGRLQPDHADVVGPVRARARRRRSDRPPSTGMPSGLPHLGDQTEGAAVGVVAEQDPLPLAAGGAGCCPRRRGRWRTPGRACACSSEATWRLEGGAGRVARAGVLEALVAADAVLGERRRQRDRGDDRTGRRVRLLTGVDRTGREPVLHLGGCEVVPCSARPVSLDGSASLAAAIAPKYASMSVRVSTLERSAARQHEQGRRRLEHRDGQFDLLADADRRQLGAHHLLDRRRTSRPGRGGWPPSARARRRSPTPRRRRTAACSCTPAAG